MDAASDAYRGESLDLGRLEMWTDVQGPDDAESVLLLAGADAPGFRWTSAIVSPLLKAGYRVVRFDHRDCGRSTKFAPADAYRLSELADDMVALLAVLSIDKAHLIGRSMGAMVAQILALDHAPLVRSLTLMSTTPGAGDDRLPPPADTFVDKMMTRLFEGAPDDPDAQVEWIVELAYLMHGPLYPFDRGTETIMARSEVTTGWSAETGHGVAVHSSPSRLDRLQEITAPTMVVHGSADPVFGPAHGRALARGIEGAVLVEVDGLGHEVPDALIGELWPIIRHHLEAAAAWPSL